MSLNYPVSLPLKTREAVHNLVHPCVYFRPHLFLSSELLVIFRVNQNDSSAFIFTLISTSNAYPY